MTPLKVGLNLIPLAEGGGGIARYGQELAEALALRPDVEAHIFTGLDGPVDLLSASWLEGVHHTRVPVRVSGPPLHLLAQFGVLPVAAVVRGLDVVHTPTNAGPVRIPGTAAVITLHDTIWLSMPEAWGSPEAVRSMHRIVRLTAPRADRLLVGTEEAALDLQRYLGLDRERIDVVPHGVRVDPDAPFTPELELRDRLGLGGDAPVILCVAQKRPYKNQELLVRALAEPALLEARLVLPGAPTPYQQHLEELARALGVGDRLSTPGWVDAVDLEGLYRMSRCFALPSRMEGFGLPVLEAMARGLPVACSNASALPEVAGDAALLFDPDDVVGAAAVLARLTSDTDEARELVERGRRRAATFTWAAAADATVASYNRALAGRQARSRRWSSRSRRNS